MLALAKPLLISKKVMHSHGVSSLTPAFEGQYAIQLSYGCVTKGLAGDVAFAQALMAASAAINPWRLAEPPWV